MSSSIGPASRGAGRRATYRSAVSAAYAGGSLLAMR